MIHIIANPVAGGGHAVPAASSLARALADAGLACHVHVPSDQADTRATARRVAPTGTVIACGGDGTVHDCLQGIMTSGAEHPSMALWPIGTGNDIARGLTSLDTTDSTALVEALLAGTFRAIDVGVIDVDENGETEAETQFFLGVLSCGFDSTVNERANAMPAVVGRARYLLGVARELPRYRPRWFAIDSDGEDKSMAAMVVAVGNGPAYGSGMYICPDAEFDDGLFDVTVVTNTPKRTFVSVMPRVYTGRHLEHESVESWRAASLRIDAPESVVYADGERIGPLPVRIGVRPSALRFVGGSPEPRVDH